ncbi:unnamed protein product [Parnassius mnemosyne]|uniref:Uncharacterized protein n=1 Tax=Parnassius mnemosyne TaxID=213953 RepID=A0AAV1M3B9_9NEOP
MVRYSTENPENWRTIACLPKQRGCRRGARGCKDHLMVYKAILEDEHQAQKNLSDVETNLKVKYGKI